MTRKDARGLRVAFATDIAGIGVDDEVAAICRKAAASAPAGLSSDGLPIGMQIVAPRFEEPPILNVARLIHAQSGVDWPPTES